MHPQQTQVCIQLEAIYQLLILKASFRGFLGLIQQSFNSRIQKFNVHELSNNNIGKNLPANRLRIRNNKIELKWLNLSEIVTRSDVKNYF